MSKHLKTGSGFLMANAGILTFPVSGGGIDPDPDPGEGGEGVPGTSGTTAMTLTEFYSSHAFARPVAQRSALSMSDPAGPWADVVFMFDFTGDAPVYPQVRVTNAAGGAVVKNWVTLTSVTAAAGKGRGVARIPQGGFYLHELRDGQQVNNPATTSMATKSWGVGVNILLVGQSNMLRTLSAGSFEDVVPGSNGLNEFQYWNSGASNAAQFGTSGYMHPNNNGSPSGGSSAPAVGGGTLSTMRVVAQALQVKYGKLVPVGLIPWAESGKSIGELSPDGAISSPLFNGSGAPPGTMGMKSPPNIFTSDFEGMVWHQGESSNEMSRASYLEALKDLYANLRARVAPYGRTVENLFFLPAILGPYDNVSQVEGKRGAVLDLDAYARANNWPKVRAGWNCIDLDTGYAGSDGLHFDDIPGGPQFRRWSAKRMTQAILWALDCSTFTGLGPRITGITRSGNVLTATVAHDGGAALAARNTGAAITGWTVKSGSTDVAAVVAVASATTITLTLPGGTAYPVTVQHGGGMKPTVSNLIVDDIAYPQGCTGTDLMTNGRPLLPTPDPITVA